MQLLLYGHLGAAQQAQNIIYHIKTLLNKDADPPNRNYKRSLTTRSFQTRQQSVVRRWRWAWGVKLLLKLVRTKATNNTMSPVKCLLWVFIAPSSEHTVCSLETHRENWLTDITLIASVWSAEVSLGSLGRSYLRRCRFDLCGLNFCNAEKKFIFFGRRI